MNNMSSIPIESARRRQWKRGFNKWHCLCDSDNESTQIWTTIYLSMKYLEESSRLIKDNFHIHVHITPRNDSDI